MKIPKLPFSKTIIDVQWAFISIATASLAHFVLRIILGRELGVEGLGVYTLAFTIYLLGVQFAAFGIHAALTKYIAEYIDDLERIKTYVSSGMTASIITGAIMGVIIFLLAPYIAISFFQIPELEFPIQLTAFCYPFIAIQKTVLGTLNGFRRMHILAFINIVQNVFVVVTSIILVIYYKMDILGAMVALVGPTILIGLVSPILIWNFFSLDYRSLWDTSTIRKINLFGFYVVLANTISFINTQIDSILIGYFLGSTEVGIYAVAVLFSQPLTLIPSAVQQITAPISATLYGKGDIEGIRRVVFSTMKKILIVSLILAVVIAILAQPVIVFFFTTEFISSYGPLIILLIGQAIFAGFMAVSSTLASIGKVNVLFRIHAICVVLNTILNIILIPSLGITGAAIATTTTLVISFVINIILIQKFTSSHYGVTS